MAIRTFRTDVYKLMVRVKFREMRLGYKQDESEADALKDMHGRQTSLHSARENYDDQKL